MQNLCADMQAQSHIWILGKSLLPMLQLIHEPYIVTPFCKGNFYDSSYIRIL